MRTRQRLRGLTLIEVLVALTLVTVVAAVTVPAFGRALEKARFDAAARELVSALRNVRREAIRTQNEATLVLDVSTGQFSVGRNPADALPPAPTRFEYELITAESEILGDTRGAIRFFPDGSSTGGTIRLSHGSRAWMIETDWLTGRVEVTQ